MTDLEYFKSLFDREQLRKVELNNEVNIPIGIITLISGGIVLVFKESVKSYCSLNFILIILIGALLLVSILFLAKSYNNLFKGFKYDYLPNTHELFKHKLELKAYNKKVSKKERESFKEYLVENYAKLNDKNMKINRARLQSLYVAKTLVFIALFLTIILIASYMISSLKTI